MSHPPRILVTGSRDWADRDTIRSALLTEINAALFAEDSKWPVLVHGGCPTGADAIADEVWRDLMTRYTSLDEPEVHAADWRSEGRAAGPKRNARMVALGADVVLAFPIGKSPGTRGCMALARKAGIPVVDYDPALSEGAA